MESANYTSLPRESVTYRLDLSGCLVEQRQHLEFSSSLPHNCLFSNLSFCKNIQILLTQLALNSICTIAPLASISSCVLEGGNSYPSREQDQRSHPHGEPHRYQTL